MRFQGFKVQKRIVSAETICGNTVYTLYLILKDVMGNLGPSMIWTNCPGTQIYDRCLKVQFPSETDFALLTEKSPFNKCIYEGYFKKAPKTRVFVSSEECPITDGSKIQVKL